MPAIQWYNIHPQRDIIHEVTGLNVVGCWRSLNSMADSSTTTAPILNLIAGHCWARRQLRSGIKDASVALELRKSLPFVRVVFIDTLAIQELDGRFLHNHCSDPESHCGDRWARRQLRNGIRYVPVASKLRKSLSSVEGVLGIKLAIFYSMADYSTTA